MKILIAEDDLVTRELLKRILSHMADEIVEAGDGLEALEKIESEDPDFLFTDLQMPELDGRALVEAVRSSKNHRLLPIVCMSAVKDKNEITTLVTLGIQDYVLKPIRPAEVQERFRKVLVQHSGWRRRQLGDGARTLLLVDPDQNFRDFVKPLLEGHFAVLEATSPAHALRVIKDADVKPAVVVMARGMPLVAELQLQGFLRKLAEAAQSPAPQFWLCSDDDAPPADLAAQFAGHVRRSFAPEVLAAEIKRTLLLGTAPADKLAAHLRDSARSWLGSIARHTLGTMLGQELTVVPADAATGIEAGFGGELQLTAADMRVRLTVACSRTDGLALARAVLQRGPEFDEEGPTAQVLSELTSTIGDRVRAALTERGFDLTAGSASVATDFATDASASCTLAEWFATTSGSRFLVALLADGGDEPALLSEPDATAPEPEPAASAAT